MEVVIHLTNRTQKILGTQRLNSLVQTPRLGKSNFASSIVITNACASHTAVMSIKKSSLEINKGDIRWRQQQAISNI